MHIICAYNSYGIYHAHAVTRLRSKYRQPYLESGLESDAESDVESGLESDVESDVKSGLESDVESGLENDAESDVESDAKSDVEHDVDTESGLAAISTSKCDLVTALSRLWSTLRIEYHVLLALSRAPIFVAFGVP